MTPAEIAKLRAEGWTDCADAIEAGQRLQNHELRRLLGEQLQKCRQCGQTRSQHCNLDEPGIYHPAGCELMHHEFKP